MYTVYLDKMLCPIAPERIQLQINSKNKTLTLINEGEVNILKQAGLSEVSFDLLLPNIRYPFATYKKGFKKAKYYLDYLEKLKNRKSPFKLKIIRRLPNRRFIFNTNMLVSLEGYTISDDVKEGFDIKVSVKLKQFKNYGTKTCKIQVEENKATATPPAAERPAEKSPKPSENSNTTYTVKKGDCLWKIAKHFYGNGNQYKRIFDAKRDKISNPNRIDIGQVLTIPS